VPLHNFGVFTFGIKIIGASIFKVSFCGGSPGKFKESKNSIEKSVY
jgi:hypothetical protein